MEVALLHLLSITADITAIIAFGFGATQVWRAYLHARRQRRKTEMLEMAAELVALLAARGWRPPPHLDQQKQRNPNDRP